MDNFKEYEAFVEARENCYSCPLWEDCETCPYGEIHKDSNYYKGEILPFIHYNCRKNMTSGDIDGFVFDYRKRRHMFIEQKWTTEKNSDAQENHLRFLSKVFNEKKRSDLYKDWDFGVYKIIGDPPFHECTIMRYPDMIKIQKVNRDTLKKFLEFEISFDDIQEEDFLFKQEKEDYFKQGII